MDNHPTTAASIDLPVAGRIGIGALSLVVANAGLLYLFLVYDVTLFQLVLVYWCECLWIGLFSAAKLIAASIFGDPYGSRWASVSPGAGVFLSILVIWFAGGAFLSFVGLLLMMILWANDALPLASDGDKMMNHIGLVFGASFLLMIGHGISFVVNFLVLGEFRTARVVSLVALPFKRCAALLVAIIVAFIAVASIPALASTTGFAAVLIGFKLLWDIRLHLKERRTFAAEPRT